MKFHRENYFLAIERRRKKPNLKSKIHHFQHYRTIISTSSRSSIIILQVKLLCPQLCQIIFTVDFIATISIKPSKMNLMRIICTCFQVRKYFFPRKQQCAFCVASEVSIRVSRSHLQAGSSINPFQQSRAQLNFVDFGYHLFGGIFAKVNINNKQTGIHR